MAAGSTGAVAGIGAAAAAAGAAGRPEPLEPEPGQRCSGSTAGELGCTEPGLDVAHRLEPMACCCSGRPCSRCWDLHDTDRHLPRSVPAPGSWCWSALVAER